MIVTLCCMLSELKTDMDNLRINSMAVLKRFSEVPSVLSNVCPVSLCCHPPRSPWQLHNTVINMENVLGVTLLTDNKLALEMVGECQLHIKNRSGKVYELYITSRTTSETHTSGEATSGAAPPAASRRRSWNRAAPKKPRARPSRPRKNAKKRQNTSSTLSDFVGSYFVRVTIMAAL